MIVYGTDFKCKLENVKAILDVLQKAYLKLNTNKFLYKNIEILRHEISDKCIKSSQNKYKTNFRFQTTNYSKKLKSICRLLWLLLNNILAVYSSICRNHTPLMEKLEPENQITIKTVFIKIKEIKTSPPLASKSLSKGQEHNQVL